MLKVSELIKELQKMPKNAIVTFQDHDQLDWEFNNYVRIVELVDQSDMNIPNYVRGTYKKMDKPYVVLRP